MLNDKFVFSNQSLIVTGRNQNVEQYHDKVENPP